jgi:hypothetical protein
MNPADDQTSVTLVKHRHKDGNLIDVSDLSNPAFPRSFVLCSALITAYSLCFVQLVFFALVYD